MILGFLNTGSKCYALKLICWLISSLTCIIDWYNQFYRTTDGWDLASSSSPRPVSWCFQMAQRVQFGSTFWAREFSNTNTNVVWQILRVKKRMIFLYKSVTMWCPFYKHLNVFSQSHGDTLKHCGQDWNSNLLLHWRWCVSLPTGLWTAQHVNPWPLSPRQLQSQLPWLIIKGYRYTFTYTYTYT